MFSAPSEWIVANELTITGSIGRDHERV